MLEVDLLDFTVGSFLRHLLERVHQRLFTPEDIFQLVLEQFLDAFHPHRVLPC